MFNQISVYNLSNIVTLSGFKNLELFIPFNNQFYHTVFRFNQKFHRELNAESIKAVDNCFLITMFFQQHPKYF